MIRKDWRFCDKSFQPAGILYEKLKIFIFIFFPILMGVGNRETISHMLNMLATNFLGVILYQQSKKIFLTYFTLFMVCRPNNTKWWISPTKTCTFYRLKNSVTLTAWRYQEAIKFDWMLDDIKKEKIISALIWAKKVYLEFSALLDVRHCPKLQSRAISKKTNEANLRKWQKPWFQTHSRSV